MIYKTSEEIRKKRKEYYQKHKTEDALGHRLNLLNNKEERRLQKKSYYYSHRWLYSRVRAKQRCNNENSTGYKYYGGKGVKFLITAKEVKHLWDLYNAKDMRKPSIDRIDSNGDYTLDNCRFIELSENIGRASRQRRNSGGYENGIHKEQTRS